MASSKSAAAIAHAQPGILHRLESASARTRRIVISALALMLAALFVVGYLAYEHTTKAHKVASASDEITHQHSRVVSVLAQGTTDAKACEKSSSPYACGVRANRVVATNLRNIRHDIAGLVLPAQAEVPRRALVSSLATLADTFESIKDVHRQRDAQLLQDAITRGIRVMDAAFQDLANTLPHSWSLRDSLARPIANSPRRNYSQV